MRHSHEGFCPTPHIQPSDAQQEVSRSIIAQKHLETLLIRNRRKRYLDLHPEYFTSRDLELAGHPLLYDRLVRKFQSAVEREAEGRAKGWSGVLEADMLRSEAKLDALKHVDPNIAITYTRGVNGEIIAEDADEVPPTKEEGEKLWQTQMEWRFLRGGDKDFDYANVDQNEEYDDLQEREDEEKYFDAESPGFIVDTTSLTGETGVQDY